MGVTVLEECVGSGDERDNTEKGGLRSKSRI
jgi:hypothetical protein